MTNSKSKALAFFLNLIPGLGLMYIGKRLRAVLYPILIFGVLGLFTIWAFIYGSDGPLFAGLVIALVIWGINMLDILFTLISMPKDHEFATTHAAVEGSSLVSAVSSGTSASSSDSERFFTILLSFVPGLGHLHMGLMQRGLSFMIAFFGLLTTLIFVTLMVGHNGFIVFLGLLPIVWLYCMVDAVQLIHRKQQGEELVDRTFFEEIESQREDGRKSKVLAMILSALPGAGHMYLGLQKRGLQLMVAFLGSVYILDLLHLSLFLFVIPLIWCFSFFDALQKVSRYGQEDLVDQPVVEWFINHQRWLGIALILLGGYYAFDQFALPLIEQYAPGWSFRIRQHLQPAIVSIVLIVGGLKLLAGKQVREKRRIQDAE